ncbi:unnamed protein product, partial [marine sediment metagenome]
VFGWGYDPRKMREGQTKIEPFITRPYQDRCLHELNDAFGREDLFQGKSRAVGGTFLLLWKYAHVLTFGSGDTLMLVSCKEERVDNRADPDSLFWKLKWILDHLPTWIRPPYEATHMHIENPETGCSVIGTSTTADIARGGRKGAIGMDEFQAFPDGERSARSAQHATDCRIFLGTPDGAGNAFYTHAMKAQAGDIRAVWMHWSEDPNKAAGMYRTHEGRIEAIDVAYWRKRLGLEYDKCGPDEVNQALNDSVLDYKFVLDHKVRSPYY